MDLFAIARETSVPIDVIKQAFELFCQHAEVLSSKVDTNMVRDGALSRANFGLIMCKLTGTTLEQLPIDMRDKCQDLFERSTTGSLPFVVFASWYSSNCFREEIILSAKESGLRDLCRKYDLDFVEVDRYKRIFDELDVDGSGKCEWEEFEPLVRKCARVPANVEIPPARLKQLWKECDADGGGDVDFEEFMVFYRKYFDSTSGGTSDGFESFYRSIRPV